MSKFDAVKIKNIALAGHSGAGKTSLAEALLYKVGLTDRLGKTSEGNTICDYDAEEIKRKVSINTSLANFNYEDIKINLIDTPGLFDFEGSVYEGINAADTVLIAVSGKSGVKVGTQKAYNLATDLRKSKIFVITKLDDPNANFYNTLTDLKTVFGPTVCPVVVPIIRNSEIDGYINLIEMKAYKYDEKGKAVETEMPAGDLSDKMDYRLDGLYQAISEAVAETDDELMEKFFEGEKFTQKELIDGIHKGMNKGIITPVVCVSNTTLAGIDMLLKEFQLLLPSASEMYIPNLSSGEEAKIKCDENEPLSAFVFKTAVDPFVGKMSYIKVLSGKLQSGKDFVNSKDGKVDKLGKIYNLLGKKQEEVDVAVAGDIVVATKLEISTSDTICDASRVIEFEKINFPKPCYAMALQAKSQGDEGKISSGIQKILDEDLTLSYAMDLSTKEQILSGLGEQHLEVTVSKLKAKFGVEVVLSVPKIAYKETIKTKVKVEGKHKKQTGGHGQFGHVWIEFEPCISDELVFEEKVFGGAVPKNYFPAVEKGLQESMKKGVLAGCPVVGLKAILVDGSYHPVDSSEMAFKMAASIAYREGLKKADPVMLEPIGNLSVVVPDENTGDVMGELNKRRGRMLGMNPVKKGMTEILSEVPMKEMQDFTLYLRQVTRGMGYFEYDFVRYEQLPANLISEVLVSVGSVNAE